MDHPTTDLALPNGLAGRARVPLITKREFDFGALASGATLEYVMVKAVDTLGFGDATLIVRVHEVDIGGGATIEVSARPTAPTPEEPQTDFLGPVPVAMVVLDESTVAEVAELEALAPNFGSHVRIAVRGFQDLESQQSVKATLSVELVLHPAKSRRSLAETLKVGNVSGGTDVVLTDGSVLRGADSIDGAAGGLAMRGGDALGNGDAGSVDIAGGSAASEGTGGSIAIGAGGGAGTGKAGGSVDILAGAPGTGNVAGAGVAIGGASGSGTGAGGVVEIAAGPGGATGAGGATTISAGPGGSTSGTGGAMTIGAGPGSAGNAVGGAATVVGGTGQGSGAGGATTLRAGQGGATGAGGVLTVAGGPGGSTSGAGGAATFRGGDPTSGAGGAATMRGGNASGSGSAGGSVTIQGGSPGSGNVTGSRVDIDGGGGSGSSGGGLVEIVAGQGGATGFGGQAIVAAGAGGSTSGAGGQTTVRAGNATTSGGGGSLILSGGNAAGTDQFGGSVHLIAGNSTGTATKGSVQMGCGDATQLRVFTFSGEVNVSATSSVDIDLISGADNITQTDTGAFVDVRMNARWGTGTTGRAGIHYDRYYNRTTGNVFSNLLSLDASSNSGTVYLTAVTGALTNLVRVTINNDSGSAVTVLYSATVTLQSTVQPPS